MSWELITIMVLIFLGEIAGTIYFYIYYRNMDKIKERLSFYTEEKINKKFDEYNKKGKIVIIDDKKGVI